MEEPVEEPVVVEEEVVVVVEDKTIAANCISKRPFMGVERGTPFNNQDDIADKIDKDHRYLYGYQVCDDADGDLRSFSLILSDFQGSIESRKKLNSLGPPTAADDQGFVLDCDGYAFSSPVYSKGVIFADDTQVYGLRLVHDLNTAPTDIGSFGKGD